MTARNPDNNLEGEDSAKSPKQIGGSLFGREKSGRRKSGAKEPTAETSILGKEDLVAGKAIKKMVQPEEEGFTKGVKRGSDAYVEDEENRKQQEQADIKALAESIAESFGGNAQSPKIPGAGEPNGSGEPGNNADKLKKISDATGEITANLGVAQAELRKWVEQQAEQAQQEEAERAADIAARLSQTPETPPVVAAVEPVEPGAAAAAPEIPPAEKDDRWWITKKLHGDKMTRAEYKNATGTTEDGFDKLGSAAKTAGKGIGYTIGAPFLGAGYLGYETVRHVAKTGWLVTKILGQLGKDIWNNVSEGKWEMEGEGKSDQYTWSDIWEEWFPKKDKKSP